MRAAARSIKEAYAVRLAAEDELDKGLVHGGPHRHFQVGAEEAVGQHHAGIDEVLEKTGLIAERGKEAVSGPCQHPSTRTD